MLDFGIISMMGILITIGYYVIVAAVLYFIVKLAVKHGVDHSHTYDLLRQMKEKKTNNDK